MQRTWPLASLALAILAFGSPADAARTGASRADLCSVSELVVFATVSDVETHWADDGNIERHVLLDVERTVKGTLPTSLEVILPGGQIGSEWMWVEHVPELIKDTRYLLLLDRGDRPGTYQVVGGETGALRVANDKALSVGVTATEALASLEGCRAK